MLKRFAALVLLVVLGLVGCYEPTPTPTEPAPTATVSATPAGKDVWHTVDFESGDFSELTQRYPGANGLDMGVVWRTGDASAQVTDAQAYSGQYSVLLQSNGSNQSSAGIRVGLRATPRDTYLPSPAYYSVKLYLPACQQVGVFWNAFQFKNIRPISNDRWTSDPTVSVNIENGAGDCEMHFVLNQKLDDDGSTNKRNVATSDLSLPIAQWFDLTCYFVWSEDPNVGQITCWQDGMQIFDRHMRTATSTEYDYLYPLQWLINTYGKAPYEMYMDDLEVYTQ